MLVTPKLPLASIRQRLFDEGPAARIIRKRYAIVDPIVGKELEVSVLKLLQQEVRDPICQSIDNDTVLRHMTSAIASNQRSWATVCSANSAERRSCLMCQYSLKALMTKITDPTACETLKCELACNLGGRTRNSDAKAILENARFINDRINFYNYLIELRAAVVAVMQDATPSELTAGVAILIGDESAFESVPNLQKGPRKMAGMGPTLASEFLRNMGWSGFKPDTHIRRLLSCWYNEGDRQTVVGNRLEQFEAALGTLQKQSREFLYFSIIGERLTPDGEDIIKADQLVWLYGSVLRKNATVRPQAP